MPDPKPRTRRRWLRRLLVAVVSAAAAFAIVVIVAVQNLEWLAKWSIHRMFPGVRVELGSLRVVSSTRLEVRELALKSSRTGELLLELADGTALFRFADIWRLRLDELQLRHPNLVVSPDLGDALGVKPGGSDSKKSGGALDWGIGRLVVTEGRLRVTRFGEQSPTVDLEFSADFQNFGVGGEAGAVEHFARLKSIVATDVHGGKMLRLSDADLRFTTDELFSRDRVRAVRLGQGELTIGPALLDSLNRPSKAPSPQASATPDPQKSGWTVGALKLDGIAVLIPDAPGFIGRTSFRLTAALQDVGARDANTGQHVALTDLRVATDREPRLEFLAAASADARFTIAGLAGGRIDELTLKEPVIDFSPKVLGEARTAPPPSNPPPRKTSEPIAMSIGRLRCDFGTLRLRDLQDGTLRIAAKFAFDLKNFGTTGESAATAQEATIWDAQASRGDAEAFATLDVVQVRFTGAGLLHRRLDAVNISGGRLLVGQALQELLAGPAAKESSAPPAAPVASSSGWAIRSLEISRVRTRIEDTRPGLTELRFTLNTVLRNVEAGGATTRVLDEVQTVELTNIDLRSPLNASARIFSLRSVFVRFTLRDLARKHVREIVILRPTIFLSQDLFVYMERAGAPETAPAARPTQPAPAAGPNWSVGHLDVKFGRLMIGAGATSDVGLPLEFETTADNLALDNLATLQLQTVLRVPKQSRDFPDYKISIEEMEGDLRFSYPPDKGEKNLVQKLEMKSARWRQFRSTKPWIAVTFDASGINGQFGGEAYDGYLNGGFSFMFEQDSPWIGWLSGTEIATEQLTDIMAPQNFRMTGPLTFEVQFDAFRKVIDRVRGVFNVTTPGTLKIGKLDEILASLPPEWTAIKQSSMRIALETLRDFDYTEATGDFWFVQSQGILNLDLKGPQGSRKFEAALHDGQETDSKWQQGTLGKK